MLAAIRDRLAALVRWTTEQLAHYLEATPATGSLVPFNDSPVENAMDQLARQATAATLFAASIALVYVPWVHPALVMPIADLMRRVATIVAT